MPKCKTQNYKFLEDSIEKNLGDLEFGHNFSGTIPKTRYMKENCYNWASQK